MTAVPTNRTRPFGLGLKTLRKSVAGFGIELPPRFISFRSEVTGIGGLAIDDRGADEPHAAVRARPKNFKEIRRGIRDRAPAEVHLAPCPRGMRMRGGE